MPVSITRSYTLVGVDAVPVQVEVDILRRLPQVVIAGLPASSVRESADRVRSAILASGLDFPRQRIVVSLSPADLRKDGPGFDLPIAVGVLGSARPGCAYVGELSLSGEVRPVRGVIAMARAAKTAGLTLVCHPDNARDARAVGCAALGVRTLVEALAPEACGFEAHGYPFPPHDPPPPALDFADIRGRDAVLLQLVEAARTRRSVLFVGPPGCGKTMIAARMPGLLAPLTEDERAEVAGIQDAAGLRAPGTGFDVARPLRPPHYTVSAAGLVGTTNLRPGEVSLAHKGVLFLDEFPEFPRASLEVLRGPLEDKRVRVARSGGSVALPADFWLVAASNPCPCGNLGHPSRPCLCSTEMRERYAARLDSPLLRGALRIDLAPVPAATLLASKRGMFDTATLRALVAKGGAS